MQDARGALREMDEVLVLLDRWTDGVKIGELKASMISQLQLLEFYSPAIELSGATGRFEDAFRYTEEARARAFADQIGNQKIDARREADPALLREERRIRLRLNKLKRDRDAEQRKTLAEQSRERLENLQSALEKAEGEWGELILRLKIENSEYASLVSADPVSLRELQAQVLDEETSLVEYFVSGGDRGGVFAWVIERERFEMIRLPVSSGDLSHRVEELRKLIEAKEAFRPQAAALYRDLFAPLTPHVTHRHLIVVPHGVLHFLPFSALWDEKEGRFLGDAWTLSFAPSATVLKFIREKTAKPQKPVLVIGNPDGTLDHAAEEAKAVARLYGTDPLLGEKATESALLSRASEAGILHLAAHAELNPINPLFTSIRLAPDGDHDGNLEMHEVYGLDLSKTGLVVLSACKTQMGRLSRGDEIEGLTRAFLYAGTPAVVSSLWKVDDESAAFFMKRFYTHLRKGEG
ncbi:MAG TPA: CHAT domain-containing protein, partial [Thermoanaerobaculia bacterium]|nr:CHAT domain-containing protein [Thermoanaerobaculia bacterium]